MQFIHVLRTTSKATFSITAILLVPSPSPSPEGIAERTSRHTVSIGIRHVAWVTRAKIVVVAVHLAGVPVTLPKSILLVAAWRANPQACGRHRIYCDLRGHCMRMIYRILAVTTL